MLDYMDDVFSVAPIQLNRILILSFNLFTGGITSFLGRQCFLKEKKTENGFALNIPFSSY